MAGVLTLAGAGPAAAAPVTVDLRIEGKDATIFEGPVTTDVRSIDVADGTGEHACDGDGATPQVVRGNALVASGLALKGSWFEAFGSFTLDSVGGQDVAFDPNTNRFLAEYKNEAFSLLGACSDPIAAGDRVLFAYADGSEKLLKLAGPAQLKPGETADLKVTDAATGAAVAGASVGGQTTGADGVAKVKVDGRGETSFKATAPAAIRSNKVVVCATDGSDGSCGTRLQAAAAAPACPGPGRAANDRAVEAEGLLPAPRPADDPRRRDGTAGAAGREAAVVAQGRPALRGVLGAHRAVQAREPLLAGAVLHDRQRGALHLPAAAFPDPRQLHAGGGRRRPRRPPLAGGAGALPGALMGRRLLVVAVVLAPLAAAPAAAARVPAAQVMIVGKGDRVLAGPSSAAARHAPALRVGGRSCRVGDATPLAALLVVARAERIAVRARDEGSCGRRTADAATIYVTGVGRDRARGREGWVYKLGRRAGTTAAADPSGAFGDGRRLRASDRVLWFWCTLGGGDTCQRTLEVTPAARAVAPGAPLAVTVRGYDDNGRGVAVAGATVALGPARATTGAGGVATLTAPAAGAHELTATAPGTVRSFPVEVTVR